MPINFIPEPGQILMCDFTTGFVRPEMQKERQWVVVSPRYRRHTGCCIVVPVSTVRPEEIEPYHYQLPEGRYGCFREGEELWVKGDMVTHAAFVRLDRPFSEGRRSKVMLQSDDFKGVQKAVLAAIGLPKILDEPPASLLTTRIDETRIVIVPDKS